ncbi:hypothetical protein [Streptomyces aidingensis]|uniref:Uncharacterized protein n=1 Tax=Streptomyces aidingensis TaxID=910347 RepID=A0A1I1QUY9_9ACTN|nr:hypothetical protein [Streptomyces aidingensis]SFD25822.1 hypothetical protein SAMN05421773_11215 [Streptomyces aidingensis]
MSCGAATPTVEVVLPSVEFPAVDEIAGEALSAAAEQLQDLVVPALLGLGALSGAVLAARAATTGTRLLADAAVRAAGLQRQRLDERRRADEACRMWRSAALAVARRNALIDVVRARYRRAARAGAAPGGPPPPDPDLPPALDPAGMCLEPVLTWLAEADRRTRAAEAALARWERGAADRRAASSYGRDPETAARRTALRARRQKLLDAWASASTEEEARHAAPGGSAAVRERLGAGTAGGAPHPEELARLGEELAGAIGPAVPARDADLVEQTIAEALRLAADRPRSAHLMLWEAATILSEAERAAEQRAEAETEAALWLRLLRRPLPPGTPPLPSAEAEAEALERFLEQGGPLDPAVRGRAAARVRERQLATERLYAAELMRQAVRQLGAPGTAGRPGEPAGAGDLPVVREVAPGVHHIDWAPPHWGTEHWLRVVVARDGTARTRTMRSRATGPDNDLDAERCREARQWLAELERLAAAAGLPLRTEFTEQGTVPGTRHTPAGTGAGRTGGRHHHDGPRHRARGTEGAGA